MPDRLPASLVRNSSPNGESFVPKIGSTGVAVAVATAAAAASDHDYHDDDDEQRQGSSQH